MFSDPPWPLWLNAKGKKNLQIASIKLSQLPHIMLIKPCSAQKIRVHLSRKSELFHKLSYRRFIVAACFFSYFHFHHWLVLRDFLLLASNNSSTIVFYRSGWGFSFRAAAYSICSLSNAIISARVSCKTSFSFSSGSF